MCFMVRVADTHKAIFCKKGNLVYLSNYCVYIFFSTWPNTLKVSNQCLLMEHNLLLTMCLEKGLIQQENLKITSKLPCFCNSIKFVQVGAICKNLNGSWSTVYQTCFTYVKMCHFVNYREGQVESLIIIFQINSLHQYICQM